MAKHASLRAPARREAIQDFLDRFAALAMTAALTFAA